MSEFDMTASSGGGTEKVPPGNYLAVLVGVFSMGTQLNEYQGEEKEERRAFFVWELVGEQIAGTKKNHVIGIDLKLSTHEKAKLRKWVEARSGKKMPDGAPFNPTTELGQPCMLNVVNNKGGYPKIDSIAAVPKGVPVPQPTYKPVITTLSDFQADPGVLPEWCPWFYGSPLADHIRACVEMGGAKPQPKKKDEEYKEPKEGEPIPF